jgi:hypothetical protein
MSLSYSSEGSPALAVVIHPIINSKLSEANYTWFNLQPPCFLWGQDCLGQVFDLEIKPQSVFTVFRAFLPSANYSAE